MLETITAVNGAVNGVVWGPLGLALLFGAGAMLSVRTGFFQLVHFRYWMRQTIGAIFTDRSVTAHTGTDDQAISQFQSLCTALAATIGTGNIVGVATAILSGGPGAVFWMWVMALLGMMTSFSENVLGIFYRHRMRRARGRAARCTISPTGWDAKKAASSWAGCWPCCLQPPVCWRRSAWGT